MNREEMNKKMGQIIAKAWSDAEFKAKLLAHPKETLKEEGVEIPEGVQVNAVENTARQFHLVIPQKLDELSDQDLEGVAGGTFLSLELPLW
ncbi:NHLP leader peptide family RiPP precursor [Candidatus Contubernalis alkaliaceticus]|uniref:NHLP leader peptide family RiPP precursor n=1 Tax=Candidatus Contubernalis alkaliaceticus TaxID=338645 RepID=UPI001F4BF3C1|nr:NHLP leader peptide family RiPP precursor [Candidatus Contubernalis alkalaceticus]UNC93202.1 NHLP leader peptide family natural product precursor [Candidatus Contubernalis alkalaceticus]